MIEKNEFKVKWNENRPSDKPSNLNENYALKVLIDIKDRRIKELENEIVRLKGTTKTQEPLASVMSEKYNKFGEDA